MIKNDNRDNRDNRLRLETIYCHKSCLYCLYCRFNFEFLLRQAAKPSDELCAKAHYELSIFELIGRNLPIQNEGQKLTSDVTAGGAELFLYQSGYLTIKHADEFGYILGFPNEEVKQALYDYLQN